MRIFIKKKKIEELKSLPKNVAMSIIKELFLHILYNKILYSKDSIDLFEHIKDNNKEASARVIKSLRKKNKIL